MPAAARAAGLIPATPIPGIIPAAPRPASVRVGEGARGSVESSVVFG
jgi:hypothetical protein